MSHFELRYLNDDASLCTEQYRLISTAKAAAKSHPLSVILKVKAKGDELVSMEVAEINEKGVTGDFTPTDGAPLIDAIVVKSLAQSDAEVAEARKNAPSEIEVLQERIKLDSAKLASMLDGSYVPARRGRMASSEGAAPRDRTKSRIAEMVKELGCNDDEAVFLIGFNTNLNKKSPRAKLALEVKRNGPISIADAATNIGIDEKAARDAIKALQFNAYSNEAPVTIRLTKAGILSVIAVAPEVYDEAA